MKLFLVAPAFLRATEIVRLPAQNVQEYWATLWLHSVHVAIRITFVATLSLLAPLGVAIGTLTERSCFVGFRLNRRSYADNCIDARTFLAVKAY
jgi:hypothetical protein